MPQMRVPAVFMRGGTSKGLFFNIEDLPKDRSEWDSIFLAAMGSPDEYGRQLDGIGGGISSLSKVAVIGPPTRDDADVDFTFGQVDIAAPFVDYSGTCGNLTSAVGAFALGAGLIGVARDAEEATVRIHSSNTSKIVVARFPVSEGTAEEAGSFTLAGVPGSGARTRLEFLDPGGAATGKLLPSGRAREMLEVSGIGALEVSMVDATNPCVFVRASDLGMEGNETPASIEADRPLARTLEAVRAAAGVAMGLGASPEEISSRSPGNPKVAMVAPPCASVTLSGVTIPGDDIDICVRMISMGKPHRVVPLTGAMCLAVAARVPGSLVEQTARPCEDDQADLRVGTPSGILPVAASVRAGKTVFAERVVVYRTSRRLMEGNVVLPLSRVHQERDRS